jgi:hypothetical protein
VRLTPGIARQRVTDRLLRLRLDRERDAARRQRPAEDDEAGVDETVHEGRVLGPARLRLERP